jgi:tRNA 2-thiouridine synthesizing protein A
MNNVIGTTVQDAAGPDPIRLDLTGLKCPLPVLKARRQITQMAAGDLVEVMADDPAAPLDFEHFCRTAGHELVETRTKEAVFTFCIRAAGPKSK